MEDRAARVPSVKPEPAEVLFAAASRPFEQPQPADDHDVTARAQEGHALLGCRPVQLKQQPGRSDPWKWLISACMSGRA
jgi:hypothetical protein